MSDDKPLRTRDVCRLLDVSVDWFYRNRARLERDDDFPKPIAGLGKRWNRKAVQAWLDRDLAPRVTGAAAAAIPSDGADPDLDKRLEERAARILGQGRAA